MSSFLALSRMIVFALGFSAWLSAVHAQEAAPPLLIEPKNVLVTGVVGEQIQAEFFLRLEQPATEVKLFGMSLARTDRREQTRLPIESISAQIVPVSQPPPPENFQALPVEVWKGNPGIQEFLVRLRIDLARAPGSGEFSGNLHLRYGDRESFVNLVVKVKHGMGWPLLIIVLGAALGMIVSNYQGRGKRRDQVLAPAGKLRHQIETDTGLPPAFRNRIKALLAEVEMELNDHDYAGAENRLRKAGDLWQKWRRDTGSWQEQLEALQRLMQELSQVACADEEYVKMLVQHLEGVKKHLHDFATAEALQQALLNLDKQWSHYRDLPDLCTELNRAYGVMTPEQAEQMRVWQAAFERLRPMPEIKDEAAAEQLQAHLDKMARLKQEARVLQQALAAGEAKPTGARGDLAPQESEIQKPATHRPPIFHPPVLDSAAAWRNAAWRARLNLKLFSWFGYVVTLIFLAGSGFEQLYLSQPVFGLNPVPDYLGLFAWGFGAEAARQSVTEVVGNWRTVSFAKQEKSE